MNELSCVAIGLAGVGPPAVFFALRRTCRRIPRSTDRNAFYATRYVLSSLTIFYIVTIWQALLVTDYVSLLMYILLIFPVLDSAILILMFVKALCARPHDKSITNDVDDENLEWPRISFIMPSYEEPFDVKEMTFNSVMSIKYQGPVEFISVDNSQDIDSPDFVRWHRRLTDLRTTGKVSVKFIHNPHTQRLKPGNLDLALRRACGEYVVFVDVDSTFSCDPAALHQALRYFADDPALGFVQFHVVPTNGHFNMITRGIAQYQNLHNATDIVGGMGGFALFKGHNAIWRKSILDKIGTWHETIFGRTIVVEDFLKSLHVYTSGSYGRVCWTETGEWVPTSLASFESMWRRWIYGSIQVIAKNAGSLLRARDFTVFEKIECLRRVKFGFYPVPYLIVVAGVFLPQPVLLPYLLLLGATAVAGLVVSGKLDHRSQRPTRTREKYAARCVAGLAPFVVMWIGFVATLRFAGHTLSWLVARRITGAQAAAEQAATSLELWQVTAKGLQQPTKATDLLRRCQLRHLWHGFMILSCLWLITSDVPHPLTVTVRLYALLCFLSIMVVPAVLGGIRRTGENIAGTATIDCVRPPTG
jgi:cellulose synthase/poly-beta-1,6-N-acetylglucosamine synthase-like glycosyltransferase